MRKSVCARAEVSCVGRTRAPIRAGLRGRPIVVQLSRGTSAQRGSGNPRHFAPLKPSSQGLEPSIHLKSASPRLPRELPFMTWPGHVQPNVDSAKARARPGRRDWVIDGGRAYGPSSACPAVGWVRGLGQRLAEGPVACPGSTDAVLFAQVFDADGDVTHGSFLPRI